ncbi:Rib/alpha-like domain-containing protein [Cutibacterium sp.]|uniref:Rib/alpha-like domain-containing protein n=1 Tax=Cutibacterium sp. TaxID=1912221 RepID=UPI0026DBFCB2|nr:Rib/alpha-like domain-containing protein [Cutibacterium sp.]MDO4411923.1 Rib/alpha-like domain-containing protein [Cutibacterium sp.]
MSSSKRARKSVAGLCALAVGGTLTVTGLLYPSAYAADPDNASTVAAEETPQATDNNQPKWEDLDVVAGQSQTGPAPTDTEGKDGFPKGTTFKWVPTPQYEQVRKWITVDETTGKITASPAEDVTPGHYTVRVDVFYPDGTFDTVNSRVNVTAPQAPGSDWPDTPTVPGEPVDIPNTGGDVPEGTTVETDGPGKAEIDPETGTIKVTPDESAKPGDVIKVTVRDGDGKVLDEVTVSVKEPAASPTPTPSQPAAAPKAPAPSQSAQVTAVPTQLPRTGASGETQSPLTGLAVGGVTLLVAGSAAYAVRRRYNH